MIPWHSTRNLTLDESGVLWHHDEHGLRRLGPVEDVAGDVPGELAGEAAECLDLWRDAFDARAEAEWSYRLSVFGRG